MQRALIIPEKFGPYTLDTEHPIPEPGKNELLVKVKAVALNPADWMVQKYGVMFETFPAIAGLDLAGEVMKVGEGAERFNIGDKVFLPTEFGSQAGKEYGAYQEYALADAFTTAVIPSNISYDEAATSATALSSAYLGLHLPAPRGLGLQSPVTSPGAYADQAFFVSGGSSSMGQAAIQMAKLAGFSPIITTASLKNAEFLKSIGATHVVDRHSANLASEIKSIEGLGKVEYAFDAIGFLDNNSIKLSLEVVAPGGKVVTVNPHFQYDPTAPENEGRVVSMFNGTKKDPVNVPHYRLLWGALTGLLESGCLKPQRPEVLPGGLLGIVDGLKKLENGEVSGVKLVVRPEETK